MKSYTSKYFKFKIALVMVFVFSILLIYICQSQTNGNRKSENPYFKNSLPKNLIPIREDFLAGKSAKELILIQEMSEIVANPDKYRNNNISPKSNEELELENEAIIAITNPTLYETIKNEMYNQEEVAYRQYSLFLISNPMIAHKYIDTNPKNKKEANKWAQGIQSIKGIK